MNRNISLFLLVTVLCSCNYKRISRTDYVIAKYDHLLVSDSPTQMNDPDSESNHSAEVIYSIIIQNTSKDITYEVLTENAKFQINNSDGTVDCQTFKDEKKLAKISPNQKARIDCTINVTATSSNHLLVKDSIGVLQVPYKSPNQAPKLMTFKYSLRVEDFE